MLIKINNRKIVDTSKTPAVILFDPQEIQIIKSWQGNEDILSSNPVNWSREQSQEWLEKKKPELASLNATKNREIEEQMLVDPVPVCFHGVVQGKDSPGCPECKKLAEALRSDKTSFNTTNEIEKAMGDEDEVV